MNKIQTYLKNPDNKNIVINIFTAFSIKGLALIFSFISLPIYIKFFNNDEILGIWYTILSILTWILTFDFGIGNGLRNLLVKYYIKNDKEEINKTLVSAYLSIIVISMAILVVGSIIIFLLDWNIVLNIDSTKISDIYLKISVFICFLTIVSQFVLRLINSILYSLQKPFLNNLINLITSMIQIGAVFIIPSLDNSRNLLNLSIINFIAINIPLIVISIIVINKNFGFKNLKISFFDINRARELLSLGMKIFYNQITYLLLTGFNTYIITLVLSPSIVIEYQTYYKIFLLSSTVFSITLAPFWSATTKALEEKKYIWIKRNMNFLFGLSILSILLQTVLVIMNQFIFNVWLGENTFNVENLYSISFAFFGTLFLMQNTVSTFAMGLNKIKLQAISYSIGIGLKGLLIVLLKENFLWIYIVIIDNLIFLIYSIFEYFSIHRFIGRKLANEN